MFYPLQSFNKKIISDFNEIPICIESNDKNLEEINQITESFKDEFKNPGYNFIGSFCNKWL